MRKMLVVGLLVLAGCQGVVGPLQRPFQGAQPQDRVDDPNLTLAEQARRARDRFAYPENMPGAEPPKTALDLPEVNRYGR
jgi:hypothetical protein